MPTSGEAKQGDKEKLPGSVTCSKKDHLGPSDFHRWFGKMQRYPLFLSLLLTAQDIERGLAFIDMDSTVCFSQTTLCPSRLASALKGYLF